MNTLRKELVVKIKILSVDDMWYEHDIKMGWKCKHEDFSKCGEPSGLWLSNRAEFKGLPSRDVEKMLKQCDRPTGFFLPTKVSSKTRAGLLRRWSSKLRLAFSILKGR